MLVCRFGTQEDNTPWPDPVTSWVCSSEPKWGTKTYNCIPEVGNKALLQGYTGILR